MKDRMFVKVRELPQCLQRALTLVGYHKTDVAIEAAEQANVTSGGCDGRRAYCCVVNMVTETSNVTYGSWGVPIHLNQNQ